MVRKRNSLPINIKRQVLHEAGYKCANPVCRNRIILDIHHIIPISEKGPNTKDNLLVLCPNCHAMYHRGKIPQKSLRLWKMLLLSLNEGYDRKSIELLLALEKVKVLIVSGDGVLQCASLIAPDLVRTNRYNIGGKPATKYSVTLTEKGRALIAAWKKGHQEAVINIDTLYK